MLSLAMVQFRLSAHEPVPVRRSEWARIYDSAEWVLDSLRGLRAGQIVRKY